MIVLFEGARCTGKTTITTGIVHSLKAGGFPAQWWKADRGVAPYHDMLATLSSDFADRDKLWVVDRFHLTEYVNSLAHGRVAEKAEKDELWQKTMNIDRLLLTRDTLLVCLMASSKERSRRMIAEDRIEPITAQYMNALWVDTFRKSELPKIGIFNDKPRDIEQGRDILLQYIKSYWDKIHVVL
jgi:thymidylate kinase